MKRTLLLTFTCGLLYVTLSGWSTGPSGTPQGISTAKNGCGGAGCHGAMESNANMSLTINETGTANPITDGGEYKPNGEYNIAFSKLDPAAAKFGFIMLVTDDATDSQAGTLSNPGIPSYKISTVGSYMVAEQTSPQDPVADAYGTGVVWKAPAKGAGDVTVYVCVNSCNGNGSADAGDRWSVLTATFTEGWPASVNDVTNDVSVSVYPNPATDILNVDVLNGNGNTYEYMVYNMSGALTLQGSISSNAHMINVSGLPAGVHILKLTDGTAAKTVTFRK